MSGSARADHHHLVMLCRIISSVHFTYPPREETANVAMQIIEPDLSNTLQTRSSIYLFGVVRKNA
jgi:hypothetical protein